MKHDVAKLVADLEVVGRVSRASRDPVRLEALLCCMHYRLTQLDDVGEYPLLVQQYRKEYETLLLYRESLLRRNEL